MNRTAITREDLHIDKTIPCSVVGRVGDTVGKAEPQAPKKLTIFEVEELLLERLDSAYKIALKGECSPSFVNEILNIAKVIQTLCRTVPDAFLGAMQLSLVTPYGLIHPMHAAVICEKIAKRMRLSATERLSLVAGALTHDIGYYELQEVLAQQKEKPSVGQKIHIRRHSIYSKILLTQLGVTDPIWLDAVLHHHERIDGSGYPDGHKGGAISIHARILAVADMYSAMIRPKKYRSGSDIQGALRELFSARKTQLDAAVIQAFITEFGIYPSGSLVRLANSEIAVVRGPNKDMRAPDIMCVVTKQGVAQISPLPRQVNKSEFRIIGSELAYEYKWLKRCLKQMWPKITLF